MEGILTEGSLMMKQRYRLLDKSIVPGVTTILNVLSKPALVPWANKLGLQGIEVGKYVDALGEIGTLAHLMVENYLNTKVVDYLQDFSKSQVEKATNAFNKFLKWEKENDFKFLGSELPYVSEMYKFGGTIDIYCELNGKKTLIDLKTSRAVYSEHRTQVSAYKQLLEENDHAVEDVRILRIGRDISEGFDDISVPMIDLHFHRFKHCLSIYSLNKRLK